MSRKRPIHSDYYLGKKLLKVTASVHASTAIPNAVRHMQWNDYGADRVEIYDSSTGTLYAVMKSKLQGSNKPTLNVVYERPGARAIKAENPRRNA